MSKLFIGNARPKPQTNDLCGRNITNDEVRRAIRWLRENKSPGLDISGEVLKLLEDAPITVETG